MLIFRTLALIIWHANITYSCLKSPSRYSHFFLPSLSGMLNFRILALIIRHDILTYSCLHYQAC